MTDIKLNITDLILSFSSAMDSVSPALQNHNKRVCNIAANLAYEMGFSEEDIYQIIIAARLHDIGALSINEQEKLSNLDYDSVFTHATIGYKILKEFKLFDKISKLVLYHHRIWNYGKNKTDVYGNEVPIGSSVIQLADSIDFAINHKLYPLSQKKVVQLKLKGHAGKIFNPDVMDAFMSLSEKEFFWFDIYSDNLPQRYDNILKKYSQTINENALIDLSKSFSRIIDYRNKLTSSHSAGVAATAEAITKAAGFGQILQDKMKIAGYLHDLGKIVIPVSILEKAGPLDDNERMIMNSHTYFTYKILSSVKGLEDINNWASFHHEKLDGTGYPFHLKADQLDNMSRIMMIADIFTALREDRPYRKGLENIQAKNILAGMVKSGKIDKSIVEVLFSNYKLIDEIRENSQNTAKMFYIEATHSDE